MGLIIIAGFMMFGVAEAEFLNTSNAQQAEGYTWEYVGKQAPSGAPALTAKPENGDEYILFRLTK